MTVTPIFLVMAVILMAPHLEFQEAKLFSLACLGFALGFFIFESVFTK